MRRFTSQWYKLTALLCAFLLCVALWTPTVAAAPLAQGSAGSLSWSLTNGTLTISGDGAIPDYTEFNPAPWQEHRDSILRVNLSDGITAVGSMAFFECSALTVVWLPNSVTTVGASAFAGCSALNTVYLPSITALGDYAFSRCFSLENVTLPESLTAIGGYAFYRCESLTYMRVPTSVTAMGSSAFAYCSALLRVDVAAPLSALPEWCFYGCERLQVLTVPASATAAGDSAFTRCDALTTVYHGGTDEARQEFGDAIADSLPNFTVSQMASSTDIPPVVTDKEVVSGGDVSQETTTEIKQQGDTLIRVEQTVTTPAVDGVASGNPTDFDSTIHATLGGEQGWSDVMEEIREQISDKQSFENDYGEQPPVHAQVTLQTDLPLTGDWLKDLSGRDAVVTITAPDGSRFTINGKDIDGYSFEKSYSLRYTLTPYTDLTEEERRIVGTATCYWLSFESAFTFPVMVEVLLDPYGVHQKATLFEQVPNLPLQKLQTVMLDTRGYVSFRLAVINTTTRYLLAMNVADVVNSEVVQPSDKDNVEEFAPISDRYTITDVRGFLGLTMAEFTTLVLTVVGIFVGVVLLAVLIIVIRSKRKAKIAAIRAEVFGEESSEKTDGEDSAEEPAEQTDKDDSAEPSSKESPTEEDATEETRENPLKKALSRLQRKKK